MLNINVVCAVIEKEDKIFVTQRGYGEFKGMWEFPGGKIEEGETPEQALVREIKEELDASIKVDSYITTVNWDYPKFHLNMKVFLCHLLDQHIELLEHENAMWIDINNLDKVDFLPADKTILVEIKNFFHV